MCGKNQRLKSGKSDFRHGSEKLVHVEKQTNHGKDLEVQRDVR
jgi:hypothetical protein